MPKKFYPDGQRIALPFQGFWSGSLHDGEIERAVNDLTSDDNGNPHNKVGSKVWDLVDTGAVELRYAAAYGEAFAYTFDLKADSGSVESNRGDVSVVFDRDSLAKIVQATRGRWKDSIRRRMTDEACHPDEFKAPPSRWDAEHWRVALLVYLDGECSGGFGSYDEFRVVEDLSGNGVISNWLFEVLPEDKRAKLSRLCDVAARLNGRETTRCAPSADIPLDAMPLFRRLWTPDVGQLCDLRGVNGHGARLAQVWAYEVHALPRIRATFDKMADLTALGCRRAALCLWAWEKWLAHTSHGEALIQLYLAKGTAGADPESVLSW